MPNCLCIPVIYTGARRMIWGAEGGLLNARNLQAPVLALFAWLFPRTILKLTSWASVNFGKQGCNVRKGEHLNAGNDHGTHLA